MKTWQRDAGDAASVADVPPYSTGDRRFGTRPHENVAHAPGEMAPAPPPARDL